MIDLKTVAIELAQARQVRIETEFAGCELEELVDSLRHTRPAQMTAWRTPRSSARPARRGLGPVFVFSA